MKKIALTVLAAATLFGGTACDTYAPNTKAGAVVGGLFGAGLGAIIGHQSNRALEGMAIGGAAGAGAGALMGSAADDQAQGPPRRRYQYQDPYYDNGPPPQRYYRRY